MKSDSPFTSMTDNGVVADGYGSHTVRVNRSRLEADIAAGRIEGVEIVTPQQIRDVLQARVDEAQIRFDNNSSSNNGRRLERAKMDLDNAAGDGEYLIRGIVPSEYVEVIN